MDSRTTRQSGYKAITSLDVTSTVRLTVDSLRLKDIADRSQFMSRYEDITAAFKLMENTIQQANTNVRDLYWACLQELSQEGTLDFQIFILSFLAKVSGDPNHFESLIQIIYSSNALNREQKFFLLYQCSRYMFLDHKLNTTRAKSLMRRLYRQVYENYQRDISDYSYIPLEKRDKDLVIVITGQVLSLAHAPTKTAL